MSKHTVKEQENALRSMWRNLTNTQQKVVFASTEKLLDISKIQVNDNETVAEVFTSMDDEQKQLCMYILHKALDEIFAGSQRNDEVANETD